MPGLPSLTGDVATGPGCDPGGRGQTCPPARCPHHVSGRRFRSSDAHGLPCSLLPSERGSGPEGVRGRRRPWWGLVTQQGFVGELCGATPHTSVWGTHASAQGVKPGSLGSGVAEASPQTHCSAPRPGTGAAAAGLVTAVTELVFAGGKVSARSVSGSAAGAVAGSGRARSPEGGPGREGATSGPQDAASARAPVPGAGELRAPEPH